MVFSEVLYKRLVQLVIHWSSRLQKTQTLEIWTKLDLFTNFLKYHIFPDFKIHHAKIIVCILFYPNKYGLTE